jgi:hypothetical protein
VPEQNFVIFEKTDDISGKMLLFSGKNYMSVKIMTCPEVEFLSRPPPPPVANISWKKILGALFFRNRPPPPQLFYASYATDLAKKPRSR